MRKDINKTLKTCGKLCGKYRLEILGKSQADVARDVGYSKENVSAFECGRNDNYIIFMWYLKRGLLTEYDIEDLAGYPYEK